MSRKIISTVLIIPILLILFYVTYESNFYSGDEVVEKVSGKRQMLDQQRLKGNWSEKKQKVKGAAKFDDPDKFFEYHQKIRTNYGDTKPSYLPNYKYTEYLKAKAGRRAFSKAAALPWVERGPANVGGRTRGLLVDPDDLAKNTWYAGSVAGGIWKTTDAGENWELLTPDIPNLSTTVLAMAASNPNVIYAGTGEGFGNVDGVLGDGIFKSTDKGLNWLQLTSTAGNTDFSNVNRMEVDPADENTVVAVTGRGAFKTTDGGTTWSKNYTSSSKVEDLVTDPTAFDTLYATVRGRGIIKSTDAGDTWKEIFSTGLKGGRFEIAVSPKNPAMLYINAETSTGSGLYVSLDYGENWLLVEEEDGTSPDWLNGQGWYDNTIEAHPFDENIVFFGGIDLWKATLNVGTVKGILEVQENGVDSFMTYLSFGMPFLEGGAGLGMDYFSDISTDLESLTDVQIQFGPGKDQKAHRFLTEGYQYQDYIDVPFEVWDTVNNKQLMVSFQDQNSNGVFNLKITNGDKIFVHSLEYDPDNPAAEIAQEMGVTSSLMYVVTPKGKLGVSWDPENLPESDITFITGDVPSVKKTSVPITDGYYQYNQDDHIHVDHHNLIAIPMDEGTNSFKLLNSNDGGIAISNDGGENWQEVGDNQYNTTQFYGIDKAHGVEQFVGGTQDNGTFLSPPGTDAEDTTSYYYMIGGDGFEAIFGSADNNRIMGSSQFNYIYRTTDGGVTWGAASSGFNGWGDNTLSPFISKLAKSQSDPDLVFAITREGVMRSDNFGASWNLTPIDETDLHNGGYFSTAQVKVSIADPQVVWAGAYLGGSGKVMVSKDGGLSFTPAANYTSSIGLISGMSTHPTDPATAYVLSSGSNTPKILRTTNYGQSWSDLSGYASGGPSTNGFPNVAVYDLVVMPYNTNIMWAATEIGIVESTDGGASWALANNGLPAVSVWDMKIVDDEVIAGTHGRGIWTVALEELSDYTPPVVTLSPRINGSINLSMTGLIIDASLRSVYDSTLVKLGDQSIYKIESGVVKDTTITVSTSQSGNFMVYLESYKNGRAYKSSMQDITIFSLESASMYYVNDFEVSGDDFYTEGFTLETPADFVNAAYHTEHPYSNNTEYLLILSIPIIVAPESATLKYDDVAIVEPGESGTVFGDEEFWDYVVVEASNGGAWIPLADGYDCRAYTDWQNTYVFEGNGTAAMYKSHNINLLDTFNEGDTLVIRFRLSADPFTAGWGWAIDNLAIQETYVGVETKPAKPTEYALSQNYPNPFNPTTTIKYQLPSSGEVVLKVYDMLGQEVVTLVNATQPAGYYTEKFNASRYSSGTYIYSLRIKDNASGKTFVQNKKMMLIK